MLRNRIKMLSDAHLHHTQSDSHIVCNNWFTLKVCFPICLLHGLNSTVWHYEEFQYHSSRDGGGHALGEYSCTHSWCLHQHVVLCSRALVLPSQVYSVYYALPEEKDYDCDAFDLSVQMEKESAGRIHQESTRHECKLLCCKIRLNYDVIFLYVVSYDGASESYQITIEYMWVYINYSNF